MFSFKANFKLLIVGCVSIALFYSFNINRYDYEISEIYLKEELEVIEVNEKYSIVKGEHLYLIYNGDYILKEGNIVYIEGRVICIKNTYNSFNSFLNKRGINYEIDCDELIVTNPKTNLNARIVDNLLNDKIEQNRGYLKLILFNVKDESNISFYDTFSLYSLTYLIAISGFHIRLLLSFFKKIFKNDFFGIGVVCLYLYLLDFSISSYRAFLCYIFKKINKKLKFDLSNIDLISLIGSAFIIVNPVVMFSYSFIFSFLATFILEILNVNCKKKLGITFYLYLVNIPLMLLNYYKLNVFTLLFSIVLNGPISFLYIFSFIYLIFDKFYFLYWGVMYLFESFLNILSELNFILIFGKPSLIIVLLYYLFFLLFFVNKERKRKVKYVYLFCMMCVLLFQYYKPVFNNYEQIYFLNVGQGDCTVFIVPNSKKAVLFDTGGNKYRDIAVREIIPFLEEKGVNHVEKVIISHDDYDHNGALESLKSNFSVGEVIDSSLIKEIQIGERWFKNLNINDKRDNNGSIVLYGEYSDYKILLMGDVCKEVELDIVKEVDGLDILKVGHHGSNTSSDLCFLKEVDGKIAIISVGKNNSYGHPHKDVLEDLKKAGYVVLRTDENDDIGFGKNLFGLRFIDYFR